MEVTKYEKIVDYEFGDMFLWRSSVLVTRSSQEIKFFKYEEDEENETYYWEMYHAIESRGFLNGNMRDP